MVQVLMGTEAFDAFPSLRSAHRAPNEVLQGWMAFVSQVTVPLELLAVSSAVEAARYELEAFAHYEQAAFWLAAGTLQTVSFALGWFESMHHGVRRAWWHWQQARSWLTNYGEPSPQKPYALLLAESRSQQQRLEHLGEELRQFVVWLCQQWQLVVPETMKDGWPTDESSASAASQV
jgi:hypothetical protein